ncbi:MAG: TonB-dependent receptor, partial [Gemmatimonadetes bacterium]|nr:TonB-dependent receptor [Gemmatimonadota bacterium]
GVSPHTLAAYRSDRAQFGALVAPADRGADWSAIDERTLERYTLTLRERGYADATTARKTAAVRSFFRYLVEEEYLPANPAERLRSRRPRRTLPEVLSAEDIVALLRAADAPGPLAARNCAMLELTYAAGLRVSEVVGPTGLALGSIRFDVAEVRVMGKGSKERIVPLYEAIAERVAHYVRHARPHLLARSRARTTTDALFRVPEQPVTGQGTQLRNVGEITNRGIELGFNVHLLNRRSLAWSVGGTFTTVHNEVTDMGGVAPFSVDASRKRVQKGLPVGAWRVTTPRDTDGDGGFDASMNLFICASDPLLAIAIDDDGVRTPDAGCDGDEVGRPTPTKGGSFNTQITLFNRLSISAMADWATGHQVMDWGSVWSTFNAIYRRELIENLTCSGNAPGGDPRCFPVDQRRGRRFSSFSAISAFMYDGDWFKLREISMRYLIPETFANQFGFDRATVFGSVRNLKTWSKNVMVDPELNGLSGSGLVLGSESSITASPARAFKMGVEVVF